MTTSISIAEVKRAFSDQSLIVRVSRSELQIRFVRQTAPNADELQESDRAIDRLEGKLSKLSLPVKRSVASSTPHRLSSVTVCQRKIRWLSYNLK